MNFVFDLCNLYVKPHNIISIIVTLSNLIIGYPSDTLLCNFLHSTYKINWGVDNLFCL